VPKCLIVYYSQHGTTARVARRIAAGLGGARYQVDLYSFKHSWPTSITGYDLVGVGSPVYFCTTPLNVRAYLNSLPQLDGLPAFVFVLHGSDPGATSTMMRRALVRKGARDLGFYRCFGAELNYIFLNRGYLFSPGHPTAGELAQAEAFGGEVAARAEGKPFAEPADDGPPRAAFRALPSLATPWIVRQLFSRLFQVDAERCSCCGLCTRLCPMGNITEGKDGRPVWGRNCLFCMTCELRCPEEAVRSPLDWPVMDRLVDVFVGQVLKDAAVDRARVALRRGRIERIDQRS
jgi:flavodoxin/NAD-dependent dihydropyrimidine dehydrogenase PreA subunit